MFAACKWGVDPEGGQPACVADEVELSEAVCIVSEAVDCVAATGTCKL